MLRDESVRSLRKRPIRTPENYVLVGLRFVGKTTYLLQDSIDRGFTVISGDLVSLYGIGTNTLVKEIRKYGIKRIGFDEVHKISNRDDMLVSLYNLGLSIIATGSSLIHILSSPDLGRRIPLVSMHTLTALERYYLSGGRLISLEDPINPPEIEIGEALEIKEHAERKLISLGGFPATLKMNYIDVKQLLRSSLERSIVSDLRGNLHEYQVLLRCIAERHSNVASCFRGEIGAKKSYRKVREMLKNLENLRIIFPVKVGKINHRYFTDPAYLRLFNIDDIGLALEQAVAYAFYSRGYIVERPGGREKTRIDFYVRSPMGKVYKIEVKHGDEEPIYSDEVYVFYGGLEKKKKGKTRYIPRRAII